MKKEVLIEKGAVGSRLLAFLLDLLSTILGTIVLYFVIVYGVFATGFNYVGRNNNLKATNTSYKLDYKYGQSYTKYEEVVQEFYFVHFKDNILADYKNDGKDYSIEYIYNVLVLNLPSNPSSTNYQTSLYKYQQADDGSFDVDRLAVQVEGNGQYFERNLMDLFYGKYQDLWKYIYKYDVNYRNDYDMVVLSKKISRVVAFSISSFVFFGVFPLVNKNGSTIFEKKKKLGYVNSNDLFEIKPYKNILRPFIYFTLPAIGIYFFSRYTVILLCVLPIFINFIFIFLSKDNKDIYERIARTKSISLEESKILKNEEEFKEFAAKEEIENEEYLKTLENVKNANIERKDV